MIEAKFTPGPWHQDKYENIKDAKGEKIRVNGVSLPHQADVESIANSHLFTAAPDIYKALEAVNRYRHLENGIADLFHIVVSNDDGKQVCVGDLIDAALAKARGEAR